MIRCVLGLVYGTVYGTAHVVPGLSGGTFLVVFGCYDVVCEAFALNFKEIKKHFFFLLFFALGTVGGIVGFVRVVTFLLGNFEVQTNLFFMGIILGSVPLILNFAAEEPRRGVSALSPLFLAAGFLLVAALFLAERFGVFGVREVQSADFVFTLKIMFYSFVAAVALVMPGISGAFVLVAFGVYEMFMNGLKALDFSLIVPACAGISIGIVAGAKLVLFLLKNFRRAVYSAVLGMVVGSVLPLFPKGFGINAATAAGGVCFAAGMGLGLVSGKRSRKSAKNSAAALYKSRKP
ncbi:MAG: DUF368 domain-containing protein [Oscillospiraceae bacterium]|nr:DUF368 domain-containing protein [Oscillospiraceae bacterium]